MVWKDVKDDGGKVRVEAVSRGRGTGTSSKAECDTGTGNGLDRRTEKDSGALACR